MNEYVLGFAFDTLGSRVLLMRKLYPEWQRDKWNGVGGKIKADELPAGAMAREFAEEVLFDDPSRTSVYPTADFVNDVRVSIIQQRWRKFGELIGQDYTVHLFLAHCDFIEAARPREHEMVQLFNVAALPEGAIPNVGWMVPMAQSFARGETAQSFQIAEVV